MAEQNNQVVDLTVLAAILNELPGRVIDVKTDTAHLVGKVIKAEELKTVDGVGILRIALVEEADADPNTPLPTPIPLLVTESEVI